MYLLNPMTPLVLTFQRCLYNKPSYVAATGKVDPRCCPQHGYLWYAVLDRGRPRPAVALFLVAMAAFGRLEGNFAEEL